MNQINGGLDFFFRFLLESSSGACVVVAGVLLLQQMFQKWVTPRWRCLLWTLLIARLLLPWPPACPLSISSLWNRTSPGIAMSAPQPLLFPQQETFNPAVTPGNDAPERVTETSVDNQSPWYAAFDRGTFMGAMWLIGCLAFGLRVLFTLRSFKRRMRTARPVSTPHILEMFEACKSQINWRGNVALLSTPTVHSALISGILKPKLIFPEHQLHALRDSELRHVFLHELGHLKRRDLPVAVLAAFLQAIHWFNPLVWYGFHRMRQDREFACDALVLAQLPAEETAEYGRTLIRLMEERTSMPRMLTAVNVVENTSQLQRRLKMITQHKSNAYRLTGLGLAVFVMSALVLLTRASATPLLHKKTDIVNPIRPNTSIKSNNVRQELAQLSEKVPSVSMGTNDHTVPTPAECIAIQKALASQFSSVSAKTECQVFKVVNGVISEKPDSITTKESKSKNGFAITREHCVVEVKSGQQEEEIISCIRPDQSRELMWSKGSVKQGTITKKPKFFNAQETYDPVSYALGMYTLKIIGDSYPLEKASSRQEGDKVIVELNNNSNGDILWVELDKRYGYMPISYKKKRRNGTISQEIKFEDYRLVDDKYWLPFSISHFQRVINLKNVDGFISKVKVLDVQVNQAIPDEDFTLEFPKRTFVTDEISGTQYRTNEDIL